MRSLEANAGNFKQLTTERYLEMSAEVEILEQGVRPDSHTLQSQPAVLCPPSYFKTAAVASRVGGGVGLKREETEERGPVVTRRSVVSTSKPAADVLSAPQTVEEGWEERLVALRLENEALR